MKILKIVNIPSGGAGVARIIVYGAPGVGKTQLALAFPAPIFICTEEGLGNRAATRFEGRVTNWSDLDQALGFLFSSQHNYKTIVIDSIDWTSPLLEEEAATRHKVKDISSVDYGKGYIWVRDLWRELTNKLDLVANAHKMNIVLLAHAATGEARDPGGEKYTSWGLSLQKTSQAHLIEWADEVWFLATDITAVQTDRRGDRRCECIATGTCDRIVHTAPGVGFVAKSRSLALGEYNCGSDRMFSPLLSDFFKVNQKG